MDRRRFMRSIGQVAAGAVLLQSFGCGSEGVAGDFSPSGSSPGASSSVVVGSGIRAQVADSGGGSVTVYSEEQRVVRAAADGSTVWSQEGFNWPVAAAVDSRGRIHVVDLGDHKVLVYSANGQFEGEYGTFNLEAPRGVAIEGDTVYVVDAVLNQVQVFSLDGTYLYAVGGPEVLNGPRAVAVAANGLHVVDRGNREVKVFSLTGTLIGSYGEGKLESPSSIALSTDGRAYVADLVCGCVVVFGTDGDVVDEFRPHSASGRPGDPIFVSLRADGSLFVAAVPTFEG